MPVDVITTDQLKYHRLIANKDGKSRDRWVKNFGWYPGRQNIDFNRVAQIYCDSYHRYGKEAFMKYAERQRLNGKHCFRSSEVAKMAEKQVEDTTANVNSGAKVPLTEYGEYGRFKPTRMHFC